MTPKKYRIKYDRLNAFFLVKHRFDFNKFISGEESKIYYINFYDYILSQLSFNLTQVDLKNFETAKIYFEEMSSNRRTVFTDLRNVVNQFQQDFSLILLKLSESPNILDIIVSFPKIFELPVIDYKIGETKIDKLSLVSNYKNKAWTLDDMVNLFSPDELVLLKFSKIDSNSAVFNKALWLRYFHNNNIPLMFFEED